MNSAEVLINFKGNTSDADNAIKKEKSELESLQKTGEVAMAGIAAATDLMVGKLISQGITYNGQIETYLTRLTTLTGSAEEANNILEQIKKDALATPFEVSGLVQGESLLISTGLSAEQARKDILALGNAISASGGGNAELSRMAVNLQQIKNVGKASALDIKQFAYAGIDIYGLLADSMGVTREEASKLDVTYDMLSNALQLASIEGGKYYGAMEAQSKTYNGAMSNLNESFQVLTGNLTAGLFEAIKGIIPQLTALFDWLSANKDIVIAIVVPLLTFINVFAGLMIAQKIASLFSALWAVMMANPFALIVALIAGLVAGFLWLWDNCEGFRNFFIAMWEGIKNVFGTVVNFISSGVNMIVGFFTGMYNSIANIVNGIATVFRNTFNAIVNIVKQPINWIIDGINLFIKGLNKIKIPDWVPVVGGKGLNLKTIPRLNVGTNYVPEDQIAMIHKGEAVIPKKFNPYANGSFTGLSGSMQSKNTQPIINVYADVSTDPLGQTVTNIKTFSGGAKNDYNWGAGI